MRGTDALDQWEEHRHWTTMYQQSFHNRMACDSPSDVVPPVALGPTMTEPQDCMLLVHLLRIGLWIAIMRKFLCIAGFRAPLHRPVRCASFYVDGVVAACCFIAAVRLHVVVVAVVVILHVFVMVLFLMLQCASCQNWTFGVLVSMKMQITLCVHGTAAACFEASGGHPLGLTLSEDVLILRLFRVPFQQN